MHRIEEPPIIIMVPALPAWDNDKLPLLRQQRLTVQPTFVADFFGEIIPIFSGESLTVIIVIIPFNIGPSSLIMC